jgi:hypothetical protein
MEKKQIAILLDSPSDTKTVLESIQPLLESYNCTTILSKEWQGTMGGCSLEDMNLDQLKELVEKSALLVIPAASYSHLAKLAQTIDDEKAVWLAIQFQLKGKPIIVANNQTVLTVEQQILTPHTVQARIQSYIKQIQADQVKWVPLTKLFKTVEEQLKAYEEKKSLILAKHIEQAYREGMKELSVPANSQITPSAKDAARELKIEIKAKGG